MKFSKFGRAMLAAVLSLGVAAAFTACGYHDTIDFVYVTNSKNNPGQIDVFLVRANSGQLIPIPDSPYPSGGRNPVGLVTSPNSPYLYVINHDDNTIVEFGIGTDAKLYPQHTYNTPGTFPNAIAINSAGTFLFVTDTYQPQYTEANPGPGALVVYPINSDGSLGTPVANGNLSYYPLSIGETDVLNPTAVNVLNQTPSGSFDCGWHIRLCRQSGQHHGYRRHFGIQRWIERSTHSGALLCSLRLQCERHVQRGHCAQCDRQHTARSIPLCDR